MFPLDFFKGKRILITGNTGFKGAWLTLYLHALGAQVTGIGRRSATPSLHRLCDIASRTDQKYCDITDYASLKEVVDQSEPNMVFHLAAKTITFSSYIDPLGTFTTNAMGTANILEILRKREKPCTAVIVTSDGCYKYTEGVWGYRESDVLEGHDPYSASKNVAEIMAQSYYRSYFRDNSKVYVATCRAGNVIGGGDWSDHRIIPDCIRSWTKREALVIRHPNAVRPWGYVLDILNGYLQAAFLLHTGRINGEAFNFGPDRKSEVRVKDLVDMFWEFWNDHEFEPYRVSGSPPKVYEHHYISLDCEKAYTLLNWRPRTQLHECLEATAAWYDHYRKNKTAMYDFSMKHIYEHIKKSASHE